MQYPCEIIEIHKEISSAKREWCNVQQVLSRVPGAQSFMPRYLELKVQNEYQFQDYFSPCKVVLVEEFISGFELFRQEGRDLFDPEQLIAILLQLRRHGLNHGDLNSGNIMVRPLGHGKVETILLDWEYILDVQGMDPDLLDSPDNYASLLEELTDQDYSQAFEKGQDQDQYFDEFCSLLRQINLRVERGVR